MKAEGARKQTKKRSDGAVEGEKERSKSDPEGVNHEQAAKMKRWELAELELWQQW